ncbi:iron-sulfur cluster biosynthesis family protein [Radiobacillus sp. PE A8.2]|uniref:iron-sulfur cluster biosynthesis family protein n=1 Tax=Radiobacillus sp. PE A8.2 TaxID=3380349 RepID=UPI00388F535A
MKLSITTEAKNKIDQQDNMHNLLLFYDTEGCGCGVNGMPTIRNIKSVRDNYVRVDNDQFEVYVDQLQEVFFAEDLTLSFVNNQFRLSSPDGILNPFIPETELTKGDVTI